MNMNQLGNGIRKSLARPIHVHVAEDGEVWYCDEEADMRKGFAAAGCTPLSESPQHK